MWQTDGGAKQSTRHGGPSLTEDSQTERERYCCVYTSSGIMLTTNSSNDEEELNNFDCFGLEQLQLKISKIKSKTN